MVLALFFIVIMAIKLANYILGLGLCVDHPRFFHKTLPIFTKTKKPPKSLWYKEL